MIFVIAVVFLLVIVVARSRSVPRLDGLQTHDKGTIAWRAARSLVRVDARRLLRHPATLTGMALTPLMFWAAIGVGSTWWQADADLSLALAPFGWASILAAGYLSLWPQRHGAAELFSTMPVGETTRTTALAGAVVAPAMAAVVLLGGANLWVATRGVLGGPSPAEQLAGVMIVAGGAALGLAFARWIPRASIAGPLFAVVAVTFIEVALSESDRRLRYLAFLSPDANTGHPGLELRSSGWHALYLAGLVGLAAVVAVAKHARLKPALTAIAAVSLLVVFPAWMQVRPVSAAAAEERASILHQPEAHQTCDRSGPVAYCAYRPYAALIPEWRRVVSSVLAATPRTEAPQVIQRPDPFTDSSDCVSTPYLGLADPEIRPLVDPADIWNGDGNVHPGFEWPERLPCDGPRLNGLGLAVQTASWAVGLPASAAAGQPPCRADGEARAVAALWLAMQAIPRGDSVMRTLLAYELEDAGVSGDRPRGGASPEHLDVESWRVLSLWAVEWRLDDAMAALDLIEIDPERVAAALAADWSRYTTAATPSADLMAAVGLEQRGSSGPTRLGGANSCA